MRSMYFADEGKNPEQAAVYTLYIHISAPAILTQVHYIAAV